MYYQVTVLDKFDCVSFVSEFDTLDEAKEEASKYKNAFVERVEEDIAEQLLDILPHGSGINFDYEIRVSGARLYVSNRYDVYDDYGFYMGDLPFTVCFKNGKLAYIQFNGLTPRGYYIANKYAIKEYLYDLYYNVENKIAVAMGLSED